jgi:hypothetical protein
MTVTSITMPRKPQTTRNPIVEPIDTAEEPKKTKQVPVRFSIAELSQLESIADALGLDNSSFLRMMYRENIHRYRQRVDAINEESKNTLG